MNTILKTLVVSTTIAASLIGSLGVAEAGEWRRRHGDEVAIGAGALAAGVLLGTALASRPRYVEPAPVYDDPYYDDAPVRVYHERRVVIEEEPDYYPPPPRRVVVQRSLRPWSQAWVRYCSDRYRSFDARTGTYVGYDGREHFCTAGG